MPAPGTWPARWPGRAASWPSCCWPRSACGAVSAPAAASLPRDLWVPVEQPLPAGTRAVVIAPDGALTRLPWAALPGARPGSVLLEEYGLALAPDGQFLLDDMRAGPQKD